MNECFYMCLTKLTFLKTKFLREALEVDQSVAIQLLPAEDREGFLRKFWFQKRERIVEQF